MFGNPETTPGGRALKFYSTIRLDVRRAEQIKDGSEVLGNHVRIKVVKNKVAPPFRTAEVDIMYGEGISQTGELLDMAVERDIIEKSGSWFSYGGGHIGQGREKAKAYLGEHPDIMEEIKEKVRATPVVKKKKGKKGKGKEEAEVEETPAKDEKAKAPAENKKETGK